MSITHEALVPKGNKSPLLRLPGELRNKIYAHVLEGVHYRVVNYNGLCDRASWQPASHISDNKEESYEAKKYRLALVRTCRQICAETREIHAGLSTFHFSAPWVMVNGVAPVGSKSVVVEHNMGGGSRPELYPTAEKSLVKDVAKAFAFWGDSTTVAEVCLRLVWSTRDQPHSMQLGVVNISIGHLLINWMDLVGKAIGQVKAGVNVRGSFMSGAYEVLALNGAEDILALNEAVEALGLV